MIPEMCSGGLRATVKRYATSVTHHSKIPYAENFQGMLGGGGGGNNKTGTLIFLRISLPSDSLISHFAEIFISICSYKSHQSFET